MTNDLDTATAAIRARYLSPSLTGAYLFDGAATLRERARRTNHVAYVAVAPQGRFGLVEVPAEVKVVIEAARVALEVEIAPIRARVIAMRADGFAWDEIWSEFRGTGFGSGDSNLLGINA